MTYLEWIKKEQYELISTTEDGVQSDSLMWKRESKYGAPKCILQGKIQVQLVQLDGENGPTFNMSVHGFTKNGFATSLAAYDINEATLIKSGRAIEHRLAAAWMEMAS